MIKNNLKTRQGRGYSGLARVLTLVVMMLLFVVTGGRADNVTFKISDLYESLPEDDKRIDLPYEWHEPSGNVTVTIAFSDDSSDKIWVASGLIQLNASHKITVSAALGETLNGILFTTTPQNMSANATASIGTYNNGTWIPDDDTNSVTFTLTGNFFIQEIYVGDLNSMKVSLKEGTEDADSWMAKAGESGSFGPLPLTDVVVGTTVTLQYLGTKEVKSVNLPSTITVQEITEDIRDGWNGNEDPLTAANLPGFKEMTMEDAQNWKGAPNGYLFVIHGFSDDGKVKMVIYQNGNPAGSGEEEISLTLANYYIYLGYSFYYTTGVSAGATVPPTANNNEWQFTMPDDEVELTIHYYSLAGVTLDVSGGGGTAKLLDKEFKPLGETAVKEDDRFVLMVDRNEAYDFKTTFSTGDDSKDFMTEFSAEEYVEYFEYVKAQGIGLSLNTVLLWVTMPHVETGKLNLAVDFKKQETYTILYKTLRNPDGVSCKMARDVNSVEEVSYAAMQRGATLGDGTAVWAMKMTAAFGPSKISFVEANTPSSDAENTALVTALENATLNSAVISENTDNWTSFGDAEYLIIGGNAKVVTAVFVADASSMTTFKDYTVDAATTTGGVTYQLVVCLTDAQGYVTTAGTVTTPAAPTAPIGKTFGGWSVLVGMYPYKTGATIQQNQVVEISENTTFSAVWNPIQVTTLFGLNGGTGMGTSTTTSYGNTLSIGEPTRPGFVLDKWMVAKAVTESGVLFGRGATFDMTTPLTADQSLIALWKHVHEYRGFQISLFGDAMAKYQKYNGAMHIAVCSCNDVDIVEHEFNPAGRCSCGYQKPYAENVEVETFYGKMENGLYKNFMNGLPEFAKRGSEVKVEALHNWGDLEFKTWEYSIDGGETWNELAAFEIVGFLAPCDIKARAIYANPVKTPTVELSSRGYDDKAEYQGQTYTMGNILYQMSYKLPDGYTLLDAGIRLGDNNGISYYFIQQAKYSYDNESKGILAGIGTGVAALGALTGGLSLSFVSDVSQGIFAEEYGVNYLEREENVMEEELNASELAKHMMEDKPVNVPKYEPVYWDATVPVKGLFGSACTLPPLSFAQKNNQDHYIYGIAYITYKTPEGVTKTLYTDAIAATVNNPNCYAQKTEEQVVGVRTMTQQREATAMRRAPKREAEPQEQQTSEQLDMSSILAPQTQLVVYADGTYNAQLSDAYGYGETVTVTAPTVSGKTFSYWMADDGAVISSCESLKLTMNANTTLRAIYDAEGTAAAAAITSVTRSNDGQKINIQAFADGTIDGAGFVYSTSNAEPQIDGDGVTKVEAVSYTNLSAQQQVPASVIDRNNCWSLQIKPGEDNADVFYHVRAYTVKGSNVTYGDVKNVKLASLESGLMMIANLEAFEQGLNESLTDVKNSILTLDETTDNSGVLAEWDGHEAYVTLQRTLQTGGWNTFCLPFSMTLADFKTAIGDDNVMLKELASSSLTGETITLTFGDAASIVAGKPYLVKVTANADLSAAPFMDAIVSKDAVPFTSDHVDFIPTLGKTLVTGPVGNESNPKAVLFLAAENKLKNPTVVNDPEQESSYLKGFRAYFQLKGEGAQARSITLNLGDGETTGIVLMHNSECIMHNDVYDLQGRRVSGATQKGVYVVNSKKTVVK